MAELGLNLEFRILDGLAAQREGVLRNDTFDVYDQWFHNLDFVWPARTIQAIDIGRLKNWDKLDELALKGSLLGRPDMASGARPVDRLYVQGDGSLASTPTDLISMVPTCHCADSFAYLPNKLPEALKGEAESWGWLIDPAWRGRVALQNDPSIGAIDAALAVEARKLFGIEDLGNLTLEEIELLCDSIGELRRSGHFGGFWGSPAEATALLISGRAHISAIWMPTFVAVRRKRRELKMAAPVEGFRGWYGGLALSSLVRGRVRDAAYDYLNWWLSGPPGAVISRQGQFSSAPATVRPHLTVDEWNYWYDGLPAGADLRDPSGDVIVPAGEVRAGGSRIDQMSRIRVWNAAMDEQNFLTRKWRKCVPPAIPPRRAAS